MVLLLLFFLGSVRAALLTAITIPLSLLFAFACMHFTRHSGEPAEPRARSISASSWTARW